MHEDPSESIEMDLKDLNYPILIGAILLTSYLCFRLILTPSNTQPDSARYMLSALIQSEASIIAIVITLSLIGVQIAASAYSTRIVDVFKRTPSFWILILIYIAAMIQALRVLKLIEAEPNNTYILENDILFSYYLGAIAFLALVPYIWIILDLLKPSNIINNLSEKITAKAILSNTRPRDPDPLQPIIDIITNSLIKNDGGTIADGLNALESRFKSLIKTWKYKEPDDDDIAKNILSLFSPIGELAASRKYEYATKKLIGTVTQIGCTFAEVNYNGAALMAVDVLNEMGVKASRQNLREATTMPVEAMGEIGEKAAEHRLEGTTNRVVDDVEDMRSNAAEQDIYEAETTALIVLLNVGVMAAGAHLELTASNAIETLGIISTRATGEDLIATDWKIANSEDPRLDYAAAHRAIYPLMALSNLSLIGVEAAKQHLEEPTRNAIVALHKIGTEAIERHLDRTPDEADGFFESLLFTAIDEMKKVGVEAAKQHLEKPARNAIAALKKIEMKAVELHFDKAKIPIAIARGDIERSILQTRVYKVDRA